MENEFTFNLCNLFMHLLQNIRLQSFEEPIKLLIPKDIEIRDIFFYFI